MCTGIRIKAENSAIVYGRTMEFGIDTQSKILLIPRDYPFAGITQSEIVTGLKWKSKYAVIGANMLNQTDIVDGINEKGLAGGLFYFPDYAEYQKVTSGYVERSIAPWQLMTWILTNFANISQVKETIPTIKVDNLIFSSWGIVPPLHAIVHDSLGNSLVIEYIKGELFLHDNPIGTFVNAPEFNWHITNLNNYINLSPVNFEKLNLPGLTLKPLGQGSGMLGLPGDFTSPSRFIRATAFLQTLNQIKNEEECIDSAFHLLNLFDIPKGSVIGKEQNKNTYEFTQWTTVADLKNKKYYWHTYQNRQIYFIDLNRANLNAKSPQLFEMHKKATFTEIL